MTKFFDRYQATMRTFPVRPVPQYIQQAAQAAKMSALYRNIGFAFDHPRAHCHESMAASTRFTVDPLTEAMLEAEAVVKERERELARAEAELIDAIRPCR